MLHPQSEATVIPEEEKVLEKVLEKEKDEEVLETALVKAVIEKPLITRRYLATTRRSHPNTDITPLKKKALAKTRRRGAGTN